MFAIVRKPHNSHYLKSNAITAEFLLLPITAGKVASKPRHINITLNWTEVTNVSHSQASCTEIWL